MAQKTAFLVLPYLATSEPVEIRGVRFRSSYDVEGLSSEIAYKLKTLFAFFFLHANLRIREMVYATLEYDPDDEKSLEEVERKWSESCLLIEYLYTYPKPLGRAMNACVENASMYLFTEGNVAAAYHASNEFVENISDLTPKSNNEFLPGFRGTLLRRHMARFSVSEGSRIYPPDHIIELSIFNRDLHQAFMGVTLDKTKWALSDLLTDQLRPVTATERRVLNAMSWFSDSCRITVFEAQSLLIMAVAFETLLNIDPGNKDRVTERLRLTIKAIVGGFPRIDSWVAQFYDARSRIVHEGGSPDPLYYTIARGSPSTNTKDKAEAILHRSLAEYGRTIFHLCVDTLLSGSRMAEDVGLQESLIHNHERLKSIREAIDLKGQTQADRTSIAAKFALGLRPNWSGFDEFVETKNLLTLLRRSIQIYNDECSNRTWILAPEIEVLIKAIFDSEDASNELECFSRIVALHHELQKLPWYDHGFGVKGDDSACLVLALVSYAATVAPVEVRRTRVMPPKSVGDAS